MALETQAIVALDPQNILETVILGLSDLFEIRIVWDKETAVFAGAFAVAGGVLGGYAGGRVGALVGASIGTAAGIGTSQLVSLRAIWNKVKEQLVELLFIVYNFLRRLDPLDYVAAVEILLASRSSRRELVITMLEFIAQKLGKEVTSSLTAA